MKYKDFLRVRFPELQRQINFWSQHKRISESEMSDQSFSTGISWRYDLVFATMYVQILTAKYWYSQQIKLHPVHSDLGGFPAGSEFVFTFNP